MHKCINAFQKLVTKKGWVKYAKKKSNTGMDIIPPSTTNEHKICVSVRKLAFVCQTITLSFALSFSY